jgi:hypothetical protein
MLSHPPIFILSLSLGVPRKEDMATAIVAAWMGAARRGSQWKCPCPYNGLFVFEIKFYSFLCHMTSVNKN